jgi:hypothetical protein
LVYQRELLQALRLVNVHRKEIAVEAEREPWELYPRVYDGHTFLIDAKTMQVYTDPGEGDWYDGWDDVSTIDSGRVNLISRGCV